MSLWATKSIERIREEAADAEHGLKRALGELKLTTLGIGAIIGAGIFVLTGSAAAQYAGPSIVFSFVLAGVGCLFAGLCYAEFAAMIPIAGSAYTYAYATLGEFVAWIIGWDLILEYLFGASTVAVGWSGYFTTFLDKLGLHLPAAFTSAPLAYSTTAGFSRTGAVLNVPAVVLIALMTALLVIGIKESAVFNNVIVLVKVAMVLLVIGFGFGYVNTGNGGACPPRPGRPAGRPSTATNSTVWPALRRRCAAARAFSLNSGCSTWSTACSWSSLRSPLRLPLRRPLLTTTSRTAILWDTKNWSVLHVLDNPDPSTDVGLQRVFDVACSPAGDLLAMASYEGT